MAHQISLFEWREAVEGAVEQFVGQANLADVVQQTGQQHCAPLSFIEVEALSHLSGEIGNTPRMAGAQSLAQLDQIGEDLHGGEKTLVQPGVGRLQLGGALGHLLFQPGIEHLELFVLLARQLAQAGVFPHQSMVCQGLLGGEDQLCVIPRLGDVAPDLALVDGCDGRRRIGIAGQQDALGLRPAREHLFEKLGAIHLGHAHVGNHQIDGRYFQQFEAFLARFDGHNFKALTAKYPFHGTQDRGFVVDKQHPGSGFRGVFRGWGGGLVAHGGVKKSALAGRRWCLPHPQIRRVV